MENIIDITKANISKEHICCAFSDRKCADGYQLKKDWLLKEFDNGYIFKRIDARAKVFIEFVPAENAWSPVDAPGYLMINCFWVSGQYKGKGYAKMLLQSAIDHALANNMSGLVTVAGASKFHFMSDTKWFLSNGFEICDRLPSGFVLLVKRIKTNTVTPVFMDSVRKPFIEPNDGLVVYYSNRCPFTEYHVNVSLKESALKYNLPLKIYKIESLEQAKQAPAPATIFSLFYKGKFITTDLSICMESRFSKSFTKLIN